MLFQALSIAGELKKIGVAENKNRAGLGFQPGSFNASVKVMQPVFRSGGFIHENDQYPTSIIEDNDEDKACTNFVAHAQTCNNGLLLMFLLLVPKPIECNDPTPSPNFDFPVFEAEEENDDEDVSDELSCLLEHEEKAIQPFEKHIELVNLGSEDDVKEVKIGSQLCPKAKKGLIDLLHEYPDIFAWSYEDIPGLDSEIVDHRLLLKPECPPVK
ncbi:hypothetical protein KIW84_043800 [Lathyrus oleraceus]|uniref:Uncharacterized protein n=1 Tax=Pisum sativum TaxID=3888 RepID=A0A9D4XEX6_PEA|nr:hypothetical protein KIW84_043800 [Pisum sativum]